MFLFCKGVSCCKYCEVGVTFAFLCLPEDALGRLDSRFSLTICLLMTRTACPVLKTPFYNRTWTTHPGNCSRGSAQQEGFSCPLAFIKQLHDFIFAGVPQDFVMVQHINNLKVSLSVLT